MLSKLSERSSSLSRPRLGRSPRFTLRLEWERARWGRPPMELDCFWKLPVLAGWRSLFRYVKKRLVCPGGHLSRELPMAWDRNTVCRLAARGVFRICLCTHSHARPSLLDWTAQSLMRANRSSIAGDCVRDDTQYVHRKWDEAGCPAWDHTSF